MSILTAIPPEALPLSDGQRRMYRGGIWLIIFAESMIFVTLFSTRFLLAGGSGPLDPSDLVGLGILATLAISLVPVWRGLGAIARGDAVAMARNLAVSALIGTGVLIAIFADWTSLAFLPVSRFGETYIISTGYHAAHILISVIWLAASAVAGRRGAYSAGNHWVVEAGVLFWTFVVAMWVGLYLVFFVA